MRNGFSLVELSIVLVILGLLTGGILAGQSLIRAAELRSLNTDAQRYTTAVHTFRDKYFGLPGDFTQATRFWNSAGGTGADNACWAAQTATAPATCNGNGDGMLTSNAIVGQIRESMLAWKHLGNAGLIEGNYLGRGATSVTAGLCSQGGTDCPRLKLDNMLMHFAYNATAGTIAYGHFLWGRTESTATFLKPEEAWNVDTKLDDGRPHSGIVFSNGEASCATDDDTTEKSATYNVQNTTKSCPFRMKF